MTRNTTNRGIGSRKYFEFYYSSRDWRSYKNILARIIRWSEPGPILDVGAGLGYLIEAAMKWKIDCKGLEGSKEAVDMALSRCSEIDIRQQLLSEQFPFKDDSFSTVVMNQVIEHLEPEVADNAVTEAHRVLRPGGMLFVASPSKFNLRETKADPTHINMYSPGELKKLLSSKGFSNITPFDDALNILGDSKLSKMLGYYVFRLTHWDRLSASANCIAYKI